MPERERLLDIQNSDGGWGYRPGGSSWTEPTCYALLGLLTGLSTGLSTGEANRPVAAEQGIVRARDWLASRQNSDGGWRPRESVPESTWVTALPLLLPSLEKSPRDRATEWLLASTGKESGFWQRLRMRLLGVAVDPAQEHDGWPWYPGAAAWVAPTALTILALDKAALAGNPAARTRVEEGRQFLLARRCQDGGWNHGSTHALGYESGSYPETTGMALLALHAVAKPGLQEAAAIAQIQLAQCTSSEAGSWLTLGLCACGISPPDRQIPAHDTTMELALTLLAQAARSGQNAFLP